MRIDSANANRYIRFIILHMPLELEMQPAAPDAFFQADENVKLKHTATANCYVGFIILHIRIQIQPIAFEVSFNFDLQSQSHRSLFIEMRQKRPRARDQRMGIEIAE